MDTLLSAEYQFHAAVLGTFFGMFYNASDEFVFIQSMVPKRRPFGNGLNFGNIKSHGAKCGE